MKIHVEIRFLKDRGAEPLWRWKTTDGDGNKPRQIGACLLHGYARFEPRKAFVVEAAKLDLAAIELPPQTDKYALVDGASLMPLVRGEKASVRAFSFAENGLRSSIQDGRMKLVVYADAFKPGVWETELAGGARKPQLFDLLADPTESRNLIDDRHDDAQRLFAALHAWSDAMPDPRQDTNVSEREKQEEQRRMKGLGYTDGGIGARAGQGGGDSKKPQRQ